MSQLGEFDEFVRGATPMLLRSAILICGDRQIAEDLVQETLIRVCIHWAAIRNPAGATSYAYRTLVRLAYRFGRRPYRSREIPAGRDSELETASRTSPSLLATVADADGPSAVLRRHVAALPFRQRQTLVLRFVADLSVETTAQIMNCKVGTVKSQTAKGLATLRDRLTIDPIPLVQQRDQR